MRPKIKIVIVIMIEQIKASVNENVMPINSAKQKHIEIVTEEPRVKHGDAMSEFVGKRCGFEGTERNLADLNSGKRNIGHDEEKEVWNFANAHIRNERSEEENIGLNRNMRKPGGESSICVPPQNIYSEPVWVTSQKKCGIVPIRSSGS